MSKVDVQFNLRVPSDLKGKVEQAAKENNRSINAEAIARLESSFQMSNQDLSVALRMFEQLLLAKTSSPRKQELADRLNLAMHNINKLPRIGAELSPAYIAYDLDEEYGEDFELYFSGQLEASFSQLEKIATYLGVDPVWLIFGKKSMYRVSYERLPRDVESAIAWLAAERQTKQVYFLREDSNEGALLIVTRYNDWVCNIYTTPYCVSGCIGATGENDLRALFQLWHELCEHSNGMSICGYMLDTKSYQDILTGFSHPLSILERLHRSSWWEDIWDKKMKSSYWDGYEDLKKRILD
ncbi:hypothetical protein B9T12_09020 [Wohlfahrtiimonas chitiniclastica]|uniref:Arc family DNA-binding protein n=1 Tax=Wohlfahrtiimonas chitiniclastica TaxID=400946 RepID=UPI000B98E21B|nr:Arc family DNA-binding protein [Wohlfahrtiimonas chitiniclastica]OYQ77104.1 hypothetical protein B9T12_09020 [Wohlfahrtiimonas chitiniclastica]